MSRALTYRRWQYAVFAAVSVVATVAGWFWFVGDLVGHRWSEAVGVGILACVGTGGVILRFRHGPELLRRYAEAERNPHESAGEND
ncbi:hypothetical protein ACIB24_03565 [Spongisporangium articulatum]|uniref:Uncharacterized protein n=1 Tax=Spongisporangium articulatum TaxID=3362603 RepID=A0ABW8AIF8_9ACTN